MLVKAEEWFVRAIAAGMTRLVALSLPGSPPAETIRLTRSAWVEALWPGRVWRESRDTDRIAEAFRQLAIHEERWPAPAAFLRHLPGTPQVLALPPPKTPMPPETRAALDAWLERLRGGHDA